MVLDVLLQLSHDGLHLLDLVPGLRQLLLVHHGLAQKELVAALVCARHQSLALPKVLLVSIWLLVHFIANMAVSI